MLWAGGPDAGRPPSRAARHYALAVLQCATGSALDYGVAPGGRVVWVRARDPARLADELSDRSGYLWVVDEADYTSEAGGPWHTARAPAPVSLGGGSHQLTDVWLELQRLVGEGLLVFRQALHPPPRPPAFWLDYGQRHFLRAEQLRSLGHGAMGTVYDVPAHGQVLKETRCAVRDLVPGQGGVWQQLRFATSPLARAGRGVLPLLRYGFRRAADTQPLLSASLASAPYSRYRADWAQRRRSLLVLQTLWPKARGEPLYKLLRNPAAAPCLPEVLVRLERIVAALHAAGFAHNDLHAGNVLVQGPRHVTLIDYDLAQPANTDNTFHDYLSLACLTFQATHMDVLRKFFPRGGLRTRLAAAGLERLPRLRHYAHVGRWEPLSALDLLLFQRQHLQLLGLDPNSVSYDVEYHVPPHVTFALLACTTDTRAFRAVLVAAAGPNVRAGPHRARPRLSLHGARSPANG